MIMPFGRPGKNKKAVSKGAHHGIFETCRDWSMSILGMGGAAILGTELEQQGPLSTRRQRGKGCEPLGGDIALRHCQKGSDAGALRISNHIKTVRP